MVPGNDIIPDFQGVEYLLYGNELIIGPEVGNISSENNEIEILPGVYIVNAALEVTYGMGPEGEVVVRYEGEANRLSGSGNDPGKKGQDK